MADENIINASGADDLNKLTQAVNGLNTAIEKLGRADPALAQMSQMMQQMQQTMMNGFAEMAALSAKAGQERAQRAKGALDRIQQDEEKAWDKLNFTSQQRRSQMETATDAANARKLEKAAAAAVKDLEIAAAAENKRAAQLAADVQRQDTIQMQRVGSYVRMWEGVLAAQERADAQQKALQQKRDTELNAMQQRAGVEYVAMWEKMLAERQAVQERRDLELHGMRQKEHADYVSFWNQSLATQEAQQAKQLALAREQQYALYRIKEDGLERERRLNTTFVTSPLKSQIGIAEQAAVYAQMGGNAAQRYGSTAATADIAELRRQLAAMPGAANGSRDAIRAHNEAMREGHALARGFAGSLGGLWLTYGSLVPLAAGAAIAASLKNIVEVGKEVEYQLKFVEALGGGKVDLNAFLAVTDNTVSSVKEAAEGMRALAQNGLDAEQSLRVLPTILNLAVIGEMSVGSAALAATGAMQAFGLSMDNIGHLGDVFAQVAAASNTSVALLNESMKQASTVAQVYNVSLEEVGSALGTLAKQNITGSAAGTAYTNMLTGLYSPTRQAESALKMLGVTTSNNDGSLKNSTLLLQELRVALSKFSDSARADIINDIFTNRGAKAFAAVSENIALYTQGIDDALNSTGMMSAGVMKLEDSVEGATKRMKNAFAGTFTKAFDASPQLQALIEQIGHLAKSDGAVRILSNLADMALKAAAAFAENIGTITLLVAAFAGFKLVTSTMAAVSAAIATYEVAVVTAAGATVALGTTLTAAMGVLGPIALAIGLATAAWALYTGEVDKVHAADQKMRNSIATNIEFLTNETEAINKRNEALGRKPAPEEQLQGPALVDSISKQVADAEERLRKATNAGASDGTILRMSGQLQKLYTDLADAKKQASAESDALYTNDLARTVEKNRLERQGIQDQIEALQRKGAIEQTVNGKAVAVDPLGNDASRAIANGDRLKQLYVDVAAGTITAKQAVIELTDVQRQYNETLSGKPEKPNTKGAADDLRAAQERNRLAADLLKLEQQTEAMRDKGANKAGKMDDLTLMEREYARQRQMTDAVIAEAQANARLASQKKNSANEQAKYDTMLAIARKKGEQLDLQEAGARTDYLSNFSRQNVQIEANNLKERGKLVDAFYLDFAAKNKVAINNAALAQAKVQTDLAQAAQTGASPEKVAELEALNAQLGIYLQHMRDARTDGANGAGMAEANRAFQESLSGLQEQLSRIRERTTGAGLGGALTGALEEYKAYSSTLGTLIKQQKDLQKAADQTKKPEDQKMANKASADISNQAVRMRQVWVTAANAIGDSLANAFGRGGQAIGDLLGVTANYYTKQAALQEQFKSASEEGDGKKQKETLQEMTSLQLTSYAQMTDAAKGFFKEKSTGYKVMDAVSKAFHAAELTMTLINMAKALFATTTTTTAKLTGVALEEAATTASVGPVVAAETAKQGTYGVTALAASLAAPFPANLAAFAVVAAMLASIGVALSGGGGGSGKSISQQRQETQGTGSVLGDPSAKSESILKALELVQKNTYQGLNYSAGMLASLRSIETSMAGLGNLVVQAAGVDGKGLGSISNVKEGYSLNSAQLIAQGTVLGGPIGTAIGAMLALGSKLPGGSLITKLFGTKTTVNDQGITAPAASLDAVMSGGLNGQSYADISTRKKVFGISTGTKQSTQYAALDDEINNQFSMVIKNLASGVSAAADILGVGGDAFLQHLNTFVVDIGKISFKDLTGEEIQEQLESVFSKIGDDMAKFGVGGLEQFQKVGEGYYETLVRIASDYAAVDVVLQSFGKTFGTVGMESIAARERLIDLAGGLEAFTEQGSYFFQNFFTEAEQLAQLRTMLAPQLAAAGAGGITTVEGFKNLVMSLDLTSEAGAKAYGILMQIAPTFFDAYSETSSLVTAGDNLADKLSLQAQIFDLLGDTAAAATVKEMQRAEALKKLSPELAALTQQLWDLQDADTALTSKLDLQGQIYELTGNAAGAAAVQQQQHVLALRGLSPEMAALTQQLWDLQEAAAVTTAENNLRSVYETQKSALETTIDNLKTFRDSILDVAKSLQQGDLSTLSPEDKLKAAKSNYEDLLARAMAGDESARDQVGQAAQDYLTADRDYNASNPTYARDAATVQSDLAKLAKAANSEMQVAQQQLNQLTLQVGQLIDLNDSVDKGFVALQQAIADLASALRAEGQGGKADSTIEGIVTSLYKQLLNRAPDKAGLAYWIDVIKGGASIGDVTKGITKGPEYQGTQGPKSQTALESMYQNVFGREADSAGLAYYMKQMAGGRSLAEIEAEFRNSPEYVSQKAVGGFQSSGAVLVGERGPEVVDFRSPGRVYTAAETAGMHSSAAPIDEETKALLRRVADATEAANAQRSAMYQEEALMHEETMTVMIKQQRQMAKK